MKKRIVAILTVIGLMVAFVGCGSDMSHSQLNSEISCLTACSMAYVKKSNKCDIDYEDDWEKKEECKKAADKEDVHCDAKCYGNL